VTAVLDARPAALARPAVRRRHLRTDVAATLSPALLIAAGYVDPGNWGTDVMAGAEFGYRLVWVLAAATGAALFLQHLSARLGFASGQDLASLLRTQLNRAWRMTLIPPLLLALAVTEVVEVLGVVIGVQLLTGWPTTMSVAAATLMVLLILAAPPGGSRRAVYGCLAVVGVVYLTVLARHGAGGVAAGLRPDALPPGGLPVAVGMVGAVVMPHNLLLHSALARDLRARTNAPGELARMRRGSLVTTAVALAIALAVNCAIMSVSATSATGASRSGLSEALAHAGPVFGAATSTLFAVTLIAAGLASSITGGMASADVIGRLLPSMPGSSAARRVCCVLPAAAVAFSGLPEVTVLVWSQVVLTLVLPLVLVPLVYFTSRRAIMGSQILGRFARLGAGVIAAILLVAGVSSLCVG
jgi:manganese transport protein